MDINNVRPPLIKKEKQDPKTDMNIVNQLLNDIVLYNDVENDFPDVPFWEREKNILKNLETDARTLLEKAVMVSGIHQTVRVAVVGNFSAGKSTFINSLIQDEICPVADKSTTSSVTTFTFAHQKAFSVIDKTGEKKEISFEDYNKMIQHGNEKNTTGNSHFYVEGPWGFVRDISLLDTPGFERGEDAFTESIGGDDAVTEEVIKKDADVLFWVMDINTGTITKDQKERIERLKRETNNTISIYVVLNKSDYKTSNSRQNILEGIKNEIGHLIKDVILYNSKEQDEDQLTLHKVLSRVKTSVNNQSLSYQEAWELKFSSSVGGRGGLKFHYSDNGNESNFLHKEEYNMSIGRISTRIEVQEMLKEIGTNNKEFSYHNFERELAAYNKRKQNLNYISAKVEKEMDKLWESSFIPKLDLFIEEQVAISKAFVKNNKTVFRYMNIDNDLNEIVSSFMKLYSSNFDVFQKKIEDKLNYSIYEKELDFFGFRELFKNCLIAVDDIEDAMSQATYFFSQNLYSAFSVHTELEYSYLYEKYNNIYKKLP